ncbi:MAG: hypothetical protein LC624_01835 [Halobacteriales archaeon]|nr:hypothetical protein [Halobacteriales archaeon]
MPRRRVTRTPGAVLSVRVAPSHRRALREVMRAEGLASESEAARHLIERAAERREAERVVARLRRRRALGPRVDASEAHDRPLAGTRH